MELFQCALGSHGDDSHQRQEEEVFQRSEVEKHYQQQQQHAAERVTGLTAADMLVFPQFLTFNMLGTSFTIFFECFYHLILGKEQSPTGDLQN